MSPVGVPEYDWEGRPRLATRVLWQLITGAAARWVCIPPYHMWQSVSKSKHKIFSVCSAKRLSWVLQAWTFYSEAAAAMRRMPP